MFAVVMYSLTCATGRTQMHISCGAALPVPGEERSGTHTWLTCSAPLLSSSPHRPTFRFAGPERVSAPGGGGGGQLEAPLPYPPSPLPPLSTVTHLQTSVNKQGSDEHGQMNPVTSVELILAHCQNTAAVFLTAQCLILTGDTSKQRGVLASAQFILLPGTCKILLFIEVCAGKGL